MCPLSICPLCGRGVHGTIVRVDDQHAIDEVACNTCGTFRVSDAAKHALEGAYWTDRRWMLSGVTRRASDNGSPLELRSDNLEEFARFAQVPATPFEAMDGMMRLISTRVRDIVGRCVLDIDHDYPLTYSAGPHEFTHVMVLLESRGLIGRVGNAAREGRVEIALGLDGWSEIDRLRRTSPNSDQAFVAMSFDDDMRSLFSDAIKPALEATGYQPFRVDNRPHNEKIDDRIVAEIRQSGLVVADFTRQKNGVYWESGFAQGLGIPVIRTCNSDDLKANKLHFDTRQYLHVEWASEAELRQKLELHIRATIPGRATAKRRGRA
jgi:hypothetical protein